VKALQRTAVSLLSLTVAAVCLTSAAPASGAATGAAPASHALGTAAAAVPCVTDAAARTTATREVPKWRLGGDSAVSRSDLAALPARETTRRFVAREVEPTLPDHVYIPVYAHVIKGKHKGERKGLTGKRVRNAIAILNAGYGARQSSAGAWTRFRFRLVKVDRTRNEKWYHAYFNNGPDRKMKRKLHRGNAHTLNLYFNGGGPRNNPVLGWSRFPWQYAASPFLDGVSVNVAALPGGRAAGYNLGDTVIHEVGHWLGLLHTFQGGCEEPGDLVADTAPEGEPSFYCQTTRDTCDAEGLDPVRNFMDYSLDACMNMFTVGQVRRMESAYVKWRL
jgi:hypothetical protein